MKRSNLRRVTPLQNSSHLQRRTPLSRASAPLARMPMKQARPKPRLTAVQRRPLAERSGSCCEIGLRMICDAVATDVAHRLAEGMGGRHGAAAALNDRLSNTLHLCRPCHRWTHEYPKSARLNGWMLKTGDDPLATPVLYRGEEWVLLDDEGGTREYVIGRGEAP